MRSYEIVLYISAVGNLMYAQVCTCTDIDYAVTVLERLAEFGNESLEAYKESYETPSEKQRFHGCVQ